MSIRQLGWDPGKQLLSPCYVVEFNKNVDNQMFFLNSTTTNEIWWKKEVRFTWRIHPDDANNGKVMNRPFSIFPLLEEQIIYTFATIFFCTAFNLPCECQHTTLLLYSANLNNAAKMNLTCKRILNSFALKDKMHFICTCQSWCYLNLTEKFHLLLLLLLLLFQR